MITLSKNHKCNFDSNSSSFLNYKLYYQLSCCQTKSNLYKRIGIEMKSQTKLVAVPVLWVQSACKNHKKRMGITWHIWFPFYTTTIHFDSEVVGNQNHLKKEHTVPVEDKPARWYRDFFIQRSQKDKVWHCFSIMFTEHVLPISQNDATVPFHSPTTTKEKGCQAHQHLKWCWKTMETLSYIYLLLSYGIHNMQLR